MNTYDVIQLSSSINALLCDYSDNNEFVKSIKYNWELYEPFIVTSKEPSNTLSMLDTSFIGKISNLKLAIGSDAIAIKISNDYIQTFSKKIGQFVGEKASAFFQIGCVDDNSSYIITDKKNLPIIKCIETSLKIKCLDIEEIDNNSIVNIKNVYQKNKKKLEELI